MDVLVVMDPLERCDPVTDTSVGLMAAALGRGHRVRHCTSADVSLAGGRLVATVGDVAPADDGVRPVAGSDRVVDVAELDVVLVRSDPPVDADYLALTLLLEHVRGETLVVNDPRGLREANEKLYACRFPDLMPPTLVTADPARLAAFAEVHGAAVLKPLDGHGGAGVCLLRPDDPEGAALVTARTRGGRRHVMAQRFLPQVVDGDRRILLLDGEPLGVLRRRPAPGEFRANIGLGGSVDVVALDDGDRRVVAGLAPALRADGLWFVGIDVIDGHLSEVNVTSPTGLRQLVALSGGHQDVAVVEWLEGRTA